MSKTLGSISAGSAGEIPSLREVGGPFGGSVIVGRSTAAAFIVRHLEAYSEGLAFTLELRVSGPFTQKPDVEKQCLSFVTPRRGSSNRALVVESEDSTIRFAIALQYLTSMDHPTLHTPSWGGGARGGTGRWHRECFVKPYPTDISFSASWHEAGITSAEARLSPDVLAAAKNSIVKLDD